MLRTRIFDLVLEREHVGPVPSDAMNNAREVMDKAMSEAEWQEQIVSYARMNDWLVHHNADSRRSDPGLPDLILVRGDTVMFLECKKMTGKMRQEQTLWMGRLKTATQVKSAVVRPSDWDTLEEQLRSLR